MTQHSVGIDVVEIDRFAHWYAYPAQKLQKIFTTEEISFCLSIPPLAAQRFAVRFAAKEALFKALAPNAITDKPPFFSLCKQTSIIPSDNCPNLKINTQAISRYYCLPPTLQTQVSLSHSRTVACAIVLLEYLHTIPQQIA
jgi:phosphopantetheine--protein transferase-like protein